MDQAAMLKIRDQEIEDELVEAGYDEFMVRDRGRLVYLEDGWASACQGAAPAGYA
jgi:hypothetical protein